LLGPTPSSDFNPTYQVVSTNDNNNSARIKTLSKHVKTVAHIMKIAMDDGGKPDAPALKFFQFGQDAEIGLKRSQGNSFEEGAALGAYEIVPKVINLEGQHILQKMKF
jgi:hypothetical protein